MRLLLAVVVSVVGGCAVPAAAPPPSPGPPPGAIVYEDGSWRAGAVPVVGSRTISFDGRSPLTVTCAEGREGQRVIDRGGAADITGCGDGGYAHVAAHRTSAGGPFRAAERLGVGSVVQYNGQEYRCDGVTHAETGGWYDWQPGLTVQHSARGGGLRLVHCR